MTDVKTVSISGSRSKSTGREMIYETTRGTYPREDLAEGRYGVALRGDEIHPNHTTQLPLPNRTQQLTLYIITDEPLSQEERIGDGDGDGEGRFTEIHELCVDLFS